MRAFVAIELPGEYLEKIAKLREYFKDSQTTVRWVNPSKMHLTLKFLGEISQEMAEEASSDLLEAASKTVPFSASAYHVGVFPDRRRPRVLWIGLREGAREVISLAEKIEAIFVKVGIPKEDKQYVPHLTLGRIKSLKNIGDFKVSLEKASQTEFEAVNVKSFKLIKSMLLPEGPMYETIRTFKLRNA